MGAATKPKTPKPQNPEDVKMNGLNRIDFEKVRHRKTDKVEILKNHEFVCKRLIQIVLYITNHSEFGVFSHILGSWLREQLRCEFGCGCHVSFNFHFALHERDLRVQSAFANFVEITIKHREYCVWVLRLPLMDITLSVLQINFVGQNCGSSLLLCNVEAEDSVDLLYKSFAFSSLQVHFHHVENTLRNKT